jgi:7-carboxy-7-deazaguanine synthase
MDSAASGESSTALSAGMVQLPYKRMVLRMPEKIYKVTEIFGPVSQGEGAAIGQKTVFLRMAGCNWRCSWCDTLISVDPALIEKNHSKMTAAAIVQRVREVAGVNCPTITLSGGNPCIHDLTEVVSDLARSYSIMVETQGTHFPEWLRFCDLVTVSPKPPSSRMVTDHAQLRRDITRQSVRLVGTRFVLKVVVFDEEDYEYAQAIRRLLPSTTLYLQAGTTPGPADAPLDEVRRDILERTRWLTEKSLADPLMNHVMVLPQLHVLLYGHRRGV